MFNLFKHELFSRWVPIVGWGLLLAAWGSMYVAVYPPMADQMAGFADIELYQAMGMDMGSFGGYIAGAVVTLMPIILGIYVITISTGTLAGEEDNGTLELVVAMPLPRWQIVAMKSVALALVLLIILVIVATGNAFTLNIISQTIEVDVTPGQLFVALLGAYPMLLAFFGIGLFLGTVMPSRRLAVAVMIFIYLGSYLANSVSNLVDSMANLKYISLFSYLNTSASVFTDGLDIGNILVLLAVAAVFFGLAVVSFERRNITVGEWTWFRRSGVPAN